MRRPLIGLTMGDPAGVGPELMLRALSAPSLRDIARLAVFGDWQVLKRCADATRLPLENLPVVDATDFLQSDRFLQSTQGNPPERMVIDHCAIDAAAFIPGQVQPECGRASYEYIQSSIDAVLQGRIEAVTTGPINKEALQAAGIRFPGHTEMFAERTAAERWCMMQYSPEITCTFATVHVGYAQVPQLLTVQRVLDTIQLTGEAMQSLHQRPPRLAVCGLNPHAGEHGLFGEGEEERFIVPAIAAARNAGWEVTGPLPPDTAFLPAKRRYFDAVVCMYHDQGHIPLKALAFEQAVNTTLGLKVIRTSVDHGTAFDIAWKGEAIPDSLFAAIGMAARLSQGQSVRTEDPEIV